uniref:Uncharacterized protein n=1 Tax=Rhizophora mucronata TaxID=61149 RepID=A0A2P2QHC9_RHIMU
MTRTSEQLCEHEMKKNINNIIQCYCCLLGGIRWLNKINK